MAVRGDGVGGRDGAVGSLAVGLRGKRCKGRAREKGSRKCLPTAKILQGSIIVYTYIQCIALRCEKARADEGDDGAMALYSMYALLRALSKSLPQAVVATPSPSRHHHQCATEKSTGNRAVRLLPGFFGFVDGRTRLKSIAFGKTHSHKHSL